jgi:serine/threonine-protein kinase RIO1
MATDRANPMSGELLMRDIRNLTRYFQKLGVKTPEPVELFEKIVKETPIYI